MQQARDRSQKGRRAGTRSTVLVKPAMSDTTHGAKSATDRTDATHTLGRHLSMEADEYARRTSEPLYDLGDELFGGEGVDVEHVFDFYARAEETHAMLFSDLEAIVDTEPAAFDALEQANRTAVALALVARSVHRGDTEHLRHDVDAARWALDRAGALLDDLEDDLDL